MSYDLRIWASKKLLVGNALLTKNGYKGDGDFFVRERDGWQVTIHLCDVEPEDIRDEIMQALPGIAYLLEISVEGAASEKNVRETLRFSKSLAKDVKGVVEDPQTDTIILSAGTKKMSDGNISKGDRTEISLRWYFDDIKDFFPSKCRLLIDLFERLMPDALPKRYGQYEPPQLKLAEKGKEHLIGFLQNESIPVLYPSRPFTHLFISVPNIEREAGEYFNHGLDKKEGHPDSYYNQTQRKYRCGKVELGMQRKVFLQPDWNLAVKRLFTETAKLLKPFFAEIATYYHGIDDSELELLKNRGFSPRSGESSWWRGLPRSLEYAVVLNENYVGQWEKFKDAATEIGNGLWMVDNFGHPEYIGIMNKVGEVPPQIAKPETGHAEYFPSPQKCTVYVNKQDVAAATHGKSNKQEGAS